MKICNLQNIEKDYLNNIGIYSDDVKKITKLITYAYEDKAYSKIPYLYHDLKHIERVLVYVLWIVNLQKYKDQYYINLLLYAALYHDTGRRLFISSKMHGIKGAKIARNKLSCVFNEKELNIIEILIETHASDNDIVCYKNYKFNKSEKKTIQLLSNILKDADALDRNRLKLFKTAFCNPKYLRTKESKVILPQTNAFLHIYESALN